MSWPIRDPHKLPTHSTENKTKSTSCCSNSIPGLQDTIQLKQWSIYSEKTTTSNRISHRTVENKKRKLVLVVVGVHRIRPSPIEYFSQITQKNKEPGIKAKDPQTHPPAN